MPPIRSLTRIDPAPAQVFTAADFRAHARIRTDAEDTLIDGYIAAATDYLEGEHGILGGLSLMPQTWRLDLSLFTYGYIQSL